MVLFLLHQVDISYDVILVVLGLPLLFFPHVVTIHKFVQATVIISRFLIRVANMSLSSTLLTIVLMFVMGFDVVGVAVVIIVVVVVGIFSLLFVCLFSSTSSLVMKLFHLNVCLKVTAVNDRKLFFSSCETQLDNLI